MYTSQFTSALLSVLAVGGISASAYGGAELYGSGFSGIEERDLYAGEKLSARDLYTEERDLYTGKKLTARELYMQERAPEPEDDIFEVIMDKRNELAILEARADSIIARDDGILPTYVSVVTAIGGTAAILTWGAWGIVTLASHTTVAQWLAPFFGRTTSQVQSVAMNVRRDIESGPTPGKRAVEHNDIARRIPSVLPSGKYIVGFAINGEHAKALWYHIDTSTLKITKGTKPAGA